MSSDTTTCPFCGSPEVETVAAWGGQLITQQMRCRSCNTHFEALREAFAAPSTPEDASPWTSS